MKYQRYFFYLLATAILGGVIFYSLSSATDTTLLKTTPAPLATSSETASIKKTGIDVTFSIGSIHIATSVAEHASVLSLMQTLQNAGQLRFEGREFPTLGFFVDSLNGKKNAGGYYWFLYINGKESQKGVSQSLLKPHDAVEWKYKKGQ